MPAVLGSWILQPQPQNRVGDYEGRLAGVTTHLSTWPAAHTFLPWLEARQEGLGLQKPGLRVLELGSGTGWMGLTLAANLPGSGALVLTERQEALPILASRCESFVAAGGNAQLRTEMLDWRAFQIAGRDSEDLQPSLPAGGAFDFVLGSDLVWNSETSASLPWVVKALLEDGARQHVDTRMLYGHWHRSSKPVRMLREACDAAGLHMYPCVEYDDAKAVLEQDIIGPSGKPTETDEAKSVASAECSDVDWTSAIFDEDTKEEPPIFVVYRLELIHQRCQ